MKSTIKTFSRREPLKSLNQSHTETKSSTNVQVSFEPENVLPPWRKTLTLLDEEVSSNLPPSPEFARELYKGTNEDREFFEASKDGVFKLPGDWSLTRQSGFGAWAQLLGCSSHWEGGYLWIEVTERVAKQLVAVQAEKQGHEFENAQLQRLPKLKSRSTIDGWTRDERRRFELALETNGFTNWPKIQEAVETKSIQDCVKFYESSGQAIDARHRVRKWQQSTSPMAHQQEADEMVRRLSLATRKSSIGEFNNRRSSLLYSRRQSSILPVFVTTTVKEEEEAEEEKENNDEKFIDLSLKVLRQLLDFVPYATLLRVMSCVNRDWNRVAIASANAQAARAAARVAALPRRTLPNKSHYTGTLDWSKFAESFPTGKFIADGAYKQVYKVMNRAAGKEEAISVMDVLAIAKAGDPATVSREVSVSLVLSELVTGNVCPNFIETFQVFQAEKEAPWSSSSLKEKGFYQYIRMELCDLGNLEEYMKTVPNQCFSLEETSQVLFQMLYSLHVARICANLRHYDLKCLNFFCATRSEVGVYEVPNLGRVQVNGKAVVKLADYGTADTSCSTLGTKIGVAHFTTLENTPIEFLLIGHAPQSFAADTFALGLCVLHVLTGSMPYEEIMESVRMPACLVPVVAKAWEAPEFEALRLVLEDDDDDVLFHTLYRFLVLFGMDDDPKPKKNNKWAPHASSVWQAAYAVLISGVRETKAIKSARKRFELDCQEFNLQKGTHPLLKQARDRASILGIENLVKEMCEYDPSKRALIGDVLIKTRLFAEMVQNEHKKEAEVNVFKIADELDNNNKDLWEVW